MKKNKNIYWITINEFYFEIDIFLVKWLLQLWYNIEIITNNNNIEKKYLKEKIKCINIWKEKININWIKLDKFLEKYNFKNPEEKLWQRELKIYWINKKYLEKSSLEYFSFFDDFFYKKENYILLHNWDHYFHLIAEKVAKKNNLNVIYHNSIWIFENKIVFTNSWKYNNFWNQKYININLSEEEKQIAKDIILSKINKKPVIWWKRKLITLTLIKKLFFYYYIQFFRWKYRKDYTPLKSLWIYFIKRFYNKIFNKIKYDEFKNIDNKTLYFPMHVPNDAQITIRAYKFINQLEIVEKILKILPKWYKLAIKEHPHWIWMLNMKKFDNLRNKNLIILNPEVNSYDIINKSYTTITINSDVWYENIILGKKPITLYQSFYSWYWFTISIDLFNIKEKSFENILKNENIIINMEERIKFINSLIKVHKKWTFFKNSKLEFNLDKENINNLIFNIDNLIKNEN